MENPNPSLDFEEFKFVRQEVQFQHSMLGARIGSYATSQAFLVTALAIAYGNIDKQTALERFAVFLLPAMGIAISVLIGIAIFAACERIDIQREVMDRFPKRYELIPEARGDWTHVRSLWYAKLMPFGFVGFWLLVVWAL